MEGFGPNGGSMKKSGSLRGVLSRKTSGSAHHVGGGAAAAADGAAARWEQQVVHNGWLWQRSGAAGPGRGAAWKRRHFALYALPVGHFLAAYKDPRHAPLFAPAGGGGPGPCLLVDLCKVNYLRPASRHGSRLEGGGADGGGVQAFDLITIEQEWTLSGDTEEASRRWLRLLTLCVDRDVAVAPDDRAAFQAKMKVEQAPKGQTTSYANGTAQFHPVILKVSASGVEMMSKDTKASDEGIVVDHRENIICTSSLNQFWCYTDFFKWSVVYKKEKNKEKKRARGLMLHVFTDTSFHNKFVLYFKTKAATELATTIEFHIEKFMARMHLRKELEVGEEDLNSMYAGENFTSSLPTRSRESTREEEPPSPEVLSSDEEDESSDDERPDGTTNINKQRNSFNSMDNRSSAGSVSEDEANTKAKDPVDLLDLSSTREEANTNIPQQPTLLFSEEEVVLPTPVQEPDELLQSRTSTPNILDGVQHQQHDLKQHQPSLGGSGKSPAEGDLLSSAKPFQAGPMSNLPLPPNQKDDLNPFSFPTVSNTNIFPRPGAAHLRRRRRTLLLGGPTLARGALLEPRDDGGGGGGGLRVLWDASAPGPGPGAVAVRVTVEHATAAAAAAALVVDGVGLEGAESGLRYSIQRLGQHTNERVTLNPGECFSFLLEMKVLAPFRRSPSLVLSLSRPPAAATPPPPPAAALLRLATPVTLGHFLRPAPLGRRAFAEKWARLRAPGQERVEVVRWAPAAAAAPRSAGEEEGERPPPPPPPLGPRAVADRARACLGLAAVADVGAPPETLAALAGVLHTAAAAAAAPAGGGGGVAVGALVRLEFAPRAPNAVRVTIRTTHPLVTEALMECFKELLEENDEEEEEEEEDSPA